MTAKENLAKLTTEGNNPDTQNIDAVPTLAMLRMINAEDKKVALAVEKALPRIAEAVDIIAQAFMRGGRLVYIGAGTSGRLGILDASECVPTFGVAPGQVIGLIAGGEKAVFASVEAAEDEETEGIADLRRIDFCDGDVLVGIAASGRTPYVMGALRYARETGAKTVSLACTPDARISAYADVAIEIVTGAEAVAGSTRMKAGTAQKLVLNMLSTGSMIKTGKTYHNYMVDVAASNQKLLLRALRMTCEITGASEEEARAALEKADMNVKLAIMLLKTGLDVKEAQNALTAAQGHLRRALEEYQR